MNATEPMSMDQAIEAMVQPTEEVVEETESQSDVEDTAEPDEEQPETDSEDEGEEVEITDDTAEEESEDDTEEDDEAEDNEDEVDESEEDGPEEEVHTVKVDGEEIQVSLSELKRGYSGQKYVQKRMQQAAESQKEAVRVNEILQAQSRQFDQLLQAAQNGAMVPPKKPDKALFDSDPVKYMTLQMEYDTDLAAWQQNMAHVNQVMQQKKQADEQAMKAYIKEQRRVMLERNPDLADPATSEKFKQDVIKSAKHYGYTDEQIGNISNFKDMEVLRDAGKWRELQAKGDIVKNKSKKARTPIKAGAKKTVVKGAAYKKQRDKLRKSGSVDDALALILDPNLR